MQERMFSSAYILYEDFGRALEPPEIQSSPIIAATAAVGLAVNFMGMWFLAGGHSNIYWNEWRIKEDNLNVKAVYLETFSDTIGAGGVVVAGIVMLTTKFYLADPLISIGLALFMFPRI
jgi:cobalt-zinc-cadmium efflux system protein